MHRFLAALSGLAACAVAPQNPSPPNIVYILADDLGYGELGCYGQEKIRTPHLDRLASEGMRFTQHYCGAPVCAPSRCVLVTGKHLGHARVRNNREVKPEGQHPIHIEDVTLGEMLQGAGYVTAAIGKWGLGPVGSSGDPNAQGFDLFYGYNCQRVAHSYYPPHMWRNNEKVIINLRPARGHHRPKPDAEIDFASYIGENYAPDAMNAEVERFVRENRDRPFFLYFAPVEPHVAMQPPQEWVDRYPKEWDERPYRGDHGYVPHPRPRAGYAAMISDLDEHVGQLLDLLEELGLSNNTIVIFSSDNGPTHDVGGVDTEFFDSTGGLRGRKGRVYEGGIRVPMIARWPGHIEADSTTDHPSAFWDVMPTLADIAGCDAPADTDGISFAPTLRGAGEQPQHDFLIWEFPGYGGQRAVIFGDWKLVRSDLKPRRNAPRHEARTELFNLATDPREEHDVSEEHPEVVGRGMQILAAEIVDSSDFPMPPVGTR